MDDADEDSNWEEEYLKLVRLIAAVVVEYSIHVTDPDSLAGWALSDLKSMNADLLQAVMDGRQETAESRGLEARALIIEFLRLLD